MPARKTRSHKQTVSEYAELRDKNIEDNKAILSKILEEIKEQAPFPVLGTIIKKEKRTPRRITIDGELRRNPRRSARIQASPIVTRSRTRRGSLSSDDSSTQALSYSPEGKFKLQLRLKREEFINDGDMDYEEYSPERRRRSAPARTREEIRSPEDITEEELKMVADHSTGKVYDQAYGTTCHQCRQKTLDMKTICRNPNCSGVRGFFCGPCLRNRYGEDVRAALKNPEWICPPCRGNCNCSICRNRQGKRATGILVHLAHEYGYSNVSEYLESLKK